MRLFVFLLCLVMLVGCSRHMSIISRGAAVYKVEKIDNVFFWDEFVEKIEIIPLESNANSIIGELHKGIVLGDDIYILDFQYQFLLNFDIAGKFKKKISGKGRGPEEYFEARDFCIAGDDIYVLDYQKIHRYSRITGKKEDSWSFDGCDNFNPVNMFVFDKNEYFLWDSNPYTRNPEQGTYFKMHKMQEGTVVERIFKYEYPLFNEPKRFYMIDEQSCYIRPIDGEDIVYKLTRDSLVTSFKIDFGQMAITVPEIIELNKSSQRNAYFTSNKFKNISSVFEVKDYIYFSCIGPDAVKYSGIISKLTGNVKFGRSSTNPNFFFSDGTFLYGYFDQFSIEILNKHKVQSCFESVWLNNQYNIEDNMVLVKVLLK